MDGFIILDIISTSYNICFSYFTSFDVSMSDVNLWYAGLGHIG